MAQLTPEAQQTINELAQRYRVSDDAVFTLLNALNQGGGTMAQFYHPDLGGGGQWMQGGMTMVSDLFNHQLKATVDGLCQELVTLLHHHPFVHEPSDQIPMPGAGSNWWPADLGQPSSSGSQNNSRYAYFPQQRRLAVENYGRLRLFDTGDHQIGGVSQQQGGGDNLSFSSQFGTVTLADLPEIGTNNAPAAPMMDSGFNTVSRPAPMAPPPSNHDNQQSSTDVLAALEKIADLHARGILTEAEFSTKKAELLARL